MRVCRQLIPVFILFAEGSLFLALCHSYTAQELIDYIVCVSKYTGEMTELSFKEIFHLHSHANTDDSLLNLNVHF